MKIIKTSLEESILKIVAQIEIQDDDILWIEVDDAIMIDQAETISSILKEKLPGTKVIISSNEVSFKIVNKQTLMDVLK